MRRNLMHGNREISIAVPTSRGRDVVGKAEAVADNARSGEVGPARGNKRANKAVSAAAEPVERRGGTKENADLQSTVRTQSREGGVTGAGCIREAVTRNRQGKLTALLHYIDVDVLRASFFGLKKSAAPGVVQSFFDKVSRDWLVRFVEYRIGDQRVVRLISKWLTAGVLEDGRLIETEEGTPQGAVNHVCGQWVHQWRQRCCW